MTRCSFFEVQNPPGSPMNACWMDRPLLNVSSRKQASIDSGTCRRTHVSFPVSLPVRISCPSVPAAAGIQVRAFPPTPCWPHHITPHNPARHCFISQPKVLILLIRFWGFIYLLFNLLTSFCTRDRSQYLRRALQVLGHWALSRALSVLTRKVERRERDLSSQARLTDISFSFTLIVVCFSLCAEARPSRLHLLMH